MDVMEYIDGLISAKAGRIRKHSFIYEAAIKSQARVRYSPSTL